LTRHLLAGAAALALAAAAPAAAGFMDVGIAWRPFGDAAFREARATGRPVFLVLTAPWTWDHFLLPARVFAHDEVRTELERGWIPVLADATTWPELRTRYAIPSGLLPSLHFVGADGVPFASSAPLGVEELAYRLSDWTDPARRPVRAEPPEAATIEVPPRKLGNRAARWLVDLSARGELPVAPIHADLDPGPLLFLVEAGAAYAPRLSAEALAREIGRLRDGALLDRVDGGFHRAWAIRDTLPHYEKPLRVNARMGTLLCAQFARTGSPEVGRDALSVLRFLNDGLRVASETLYAESAAADVYDPTRTELAIPGREYYAGREGARRMSGRPPASEIVPVGGNFAAMSAFATYASVFRDERMVRAVRLAAPRLLGAGFEPDGRARRVLGRPGAGNLRDQADAGSGLLAVHALTGSAESLRAAERLADVLVERFAEPGRARLRSIADDVDAPDFVRGAPPEAAWNGAALRFLAELIAVTRETRWAPFVRRALGAWAGRVPADGRGLGELGGAAYRLDVPPPVFLLAEEPGAPEAERLLALALSVGHPWTRIRWVAPGDERDVRRRFGAEIEPEPALYLVWGSASGALRDPDVVAAVWREAAARAAR
jgi:uncharacterized protein YyaL (SSP411 family)